MGVRVLKDARVVGDLGDPDIRALGPLDVLVLGRNGCSARGSATTGVTMALIVAVVVASMMAASQGFRNSNCGDCNDDGSSGSCI